MPWQPVVISKHEVNVLMQSFPKTLRFVVDESLGPKLALVFRGLGYNATDVFALKLNGRSAEDVFAGAWNERRILLTRGRDFLDDRRFPPNRNAGIVVLPAVNDDVLIKALVHALSLVRNGSELWEGVKIVVAGDGRFSVTKHNHDTGASQTTNYKLRIAGPPLVWRSGK